MQYWLARWTSLELTMAFSCHILCVNRSHIFFTKKIEVIYLAISLFESFNGCLPFCSLANFCTDLLIAHTWLFFSGFFRVVVGYMWSGGGGGTLSLRWRLWLQLRKCQSRRDCGCSGELRGWLGVVNAEAVAGWRGLVPWVPRLLDMAERNRGSTISRPTWPKCTVQEDHNRGGLEDNYRIKSYK
jgi:hypothetical protein